MKVEDLTPEQIAVLKKIAKDGIEAHLSDKECDIRDQLEDMKLIYGSGDEYDWDIFVNRKAIVLLEQVNPRWWIDQRKSRERQIAQIKEQLVLEPMGSNDTMERITTRYKQSVADEENRHNKRMELLQKELVNSEHDLQQWIEDHKSHYPEEVK